MSYKLLTRRYRYDLDGRPEMVIERRVRSPEDHRLLVILDKDAALIEDCRRYGEENDNMMSFRRNVMAANLLKFLGIPVNVRCKTDGSMEGEPVHRSLVCRTTMFLMDGVHDLFRLQVLINDMPVFMGHGVMDTPEGTMETDVYEEVCSVGDI